MICLNLTFHTYAASCNQVLISPFNNLNRIFGRIANLSFAGLTLKICNGGKSTAWIPTVSRSIQPCWSCWAIIYILTLSPAVLTFLLPSDFSFLYILWKMLGWWKKIEHFLGEKGRKNNDILETCLISY